MPSDATDRGSFCIACGAFAPEHPASGACDACGRPMLKREARKRLELGRADGENDSRSAPLPPEVQEAARNPKNVFAAKYVLIRRIGSGGMGLVWKAWELPLSRYVAIKFLKAPSPDDVVRFEREARLAAALDHPNIIPIYDFGSAEGQYYLSMKFIDGRPLDGSPMDEARLVQVMISVCRAVHSAHESGVIHRDLKPANVMVSSEGRPIVLDFGLAKTVEGSVDLSVSGMVVGTPSYMPPEQAMGRKESITRRSDVYGLGAILYAMVAGRPPFAADVPMEILMKVVNDDLVAPRRHNPLLSAPLETIILKALEKNPDHRYSSAAELADDLERLASGRSILARPSPRRWIPRVIRRNPVLFAAGLAVVVVIAALARNRGPDPAPQLWRARFFDARKGLEAGDEGTADRWKELDALMARASGTLGTDTQDLLTWFSDQSRAGSGALDRMEQLGRAAWPGKRDEASRFRRWAAAMGALLDRLPEGFRAVQAEFRELEKRAGRIALFPGLVTLRVNVHPFASIDAMTVGSRRFIRGGKIVEASLGSASGSDLVSPIALEDLELDAYELELVHPQLGKRTFSVPKSALQAGRAYLIRGEMAPGKSIELEPIP